MYIRTFYKKLKPNKKESAKVGFVDVIFYGTLVEAFASFKEPSKYPLLAAWFDIVSKNSKVSAAVEHIKEQVFTKKKKKKITKDD